MAQYTLITGDGKVLQFYIRSVAELYRNLLGGYIISDDILVDKSKQTLYN